MEKWTENMRVEFASLLRKIIGNTTSKEYSKMTGIDTSRLSRLINAKETYAPSIKIIDRLMNGKDIVNEVTRDQMLVASGRMKNPEIQFKGIDQSDVYKNLYRQQVVKQYSAAITSVAVREWCLKLKTNENSNYSLCLEKEDSGFKWYFFIYATEQNATFERTSLRRIAGMIAELSVDSNRKYTYLTTNSEVFLNYYNRYKDIFAFPGLKANLSILYLQKESMKFVEHILAETTDPSDDVRKHHF